jgi:alkanesulfonate monooxygenase SsuD/methylene tetrahydromethanopterin reductase-like flavin-dependent oxidoreductase (luciferase family)
VAAKSPKYLAPLAGELADRVNLLGNDDERVASLVTSIRNHAISFGRDPDGILFGRLASIVLTDHPVDEGDRLDVVSERATLIGADPADLRHEHEWWVLGAVGTPDQVADELIRRTIDIGVNELVVCMDTIGTISYERTMQELRRFTAEVAPALRRAGSRIASTPEGLP